MFVLMFYLLDDHEALVRLQQLWCCSWDEHLFLGRVDELPHKPIKAT